MDPSTGAIPASAKTFIATQLRAAATAGRVPRHGDFLSTGIYFFRREHQARSSSLPSLCPLVPVLISFALWLSSFWAIPPQATEHSRRASLITWRSRRACCLGIGYRLSFPTAADCAIRYSHHFAANRDCRVPVSPTARSAVGVSRVPLALILVATAAG